MDDLEENVNLKTSHRHEKRQEKRYEKRENRRKNKSKLQLLKKHKKVYYYIFFSMIFILFIFIIIYIIYKIISTERNAFYKKIITLNEQKDIIESNNKIITKENEKYKNQLKSIISYNKSKIVAISYGSNSFKKQLEYLQKSALEIAKVDEFYPYGPDDIDKEFKNKNSYILSKGRGNGYWLWKPYFIVKTFKNHLKDGDYLIYSDAGTFFTDRAQLLVDFLNERGAQMYLHRLPHLEKYYTKRDAFILLGADLPFFTETGQFNAAFQVYKKSKFTEIFLDEYLYYAQDKRIITDDDNELGLPNYDGFIDHRHDQSVLSLLTKKYSQVNANKMNIDVSIVKNFTELMPTIFYHYRRGGYEKYEDLKNIALEANKNINSHVINKNNSNNDE